MKRDVLCRKCGQKKGEIESKRATKPKYSATFCETCHKEYVVLLKERNRSVEVRNAASERMKKNNPMQREEVAQKVSKTNKEKYRTGERISSFQDPVKMKEIRSKWNITTEGRQRISKRMLKNNPMKQPDAVQKSILTKKKHIQSGELVYKHGSEHHLWKGNGSFSEACRCQLYPYWTYKILERDNFSCTMCEAKRQLQVHHLKPLREILEEVKQMFNISSYHEISPDKRQPLIDEVLKLHKQEDGITVCSICHSKIDPRYNHNENKNNKKRTSPGNGV